MMDYFVQYGPIKDMDWLEYPASSGTETMKLHFESRSAVSAVLRNPKHIIERGTDGHKVAVKPYVKFSDNALGGEMRKKS